MAYCLFSLACCRNPISCGYVLNTSAFASSNDFSLTCSSVQSGYSSVSTSEYSFVHLHRRRMVRFSSSVSGVEAFRLFLASSLFILCCIF